MSMFLLPLLSWATGLWGSTSDFRKTLAGASTFIVTALGAVAIVVSLGFALHLASKYGAASRDAHWEHQINASNDHNAELLRKANQAGAAAAAEARSVKDTVAAATQRSAALEQALADERQKAATAEATAKTSASKLRKARKLAAVCYPPSVAKALNQ